MERLRLGRGEGNWQRGNIKKQDRIGAGWIGKAWTVFEGGTVFKFHVILTINIMEKLDANPLYRMGMYQLCNPD